jgi:hypothetical protein
MKFPTISTIQLQANRFTTLGDWWEEPEGVFHITITEESDWRYMVCCLIHELTEWAICQAKGIKTSDCDKFDGWWEGEIKRGLIPAEREAGFDRRCPYRHGHIWGCRMERLFCWLLGVSWKEYGDAADALMRAYVQK